MLISHVKIIKHVKKAEKSPWMVKKSKPGPKKKSLAESDKGLCHDQPNEETNETQAGASRVKIVRLTEKDKFKV